VPGHWEGDLITGRANRSAIATLIDRASGYTMLVHLPGRHTAEVTSLALTAAFTALPPRTVPVADLGPGHRDCRPQPVERGDRHRRLLRRPARPGSEAATRTL